MNATNERETTLEIQDVTKTFSGVKALDHVTFSIGKGEIHGLCGENGAGKSTLMNILSGTYAYGEYEGSFYLDGQECRFGSIREGEKAGVVIVRQELALTPYLSIAENIFLNNERANHGVINWKETREQARAVLERVGLGEIDEDLPVNKVGVGIQQLVEIAKALSKNARVLIFDEPTSALNDNESENLLKLIAELKKQGMTILLISHKLNELIEICDSITILRDGQTIKTLRRKDGEYSETEIIKYMIGRSIENRYPPRDVEKGEVIFEVKNWNVYHELYEDRKVINNVNLYVRRGEIVGIAGLMGAGRTELAMSIFGKSYGQNISGEIWVGGRQRNIRTIQDAIDNGIAYVSEDRKRYGLVLINGIRWNITLAHLKELSKFKTVIDPKKEEDTARQYMEKLKIKAQGLEQKTSGLSGGNQQKVVLSKWLMTQPEILILDEPTRGIDVGAKYEIYALMNQMVEEGKAVIMISSDLPEILGVADRVYVLDEGEVAGEIGKDDLSASVVMETIISHQKQHTAAK